MGTKKKEEKIVEEPELIPPGMDVLGKLSGRDYWEWRTTFTEVEVETCKKTIVDLKLQLLQKDLELSQLRIHVYKLTTLKAAEDGLHFTKSEADKWISTLEGRLGFKLKGCIIDDVTFEVKRLEDEPKAAISN